MVDLRSKIHGAGATQAVNLVVMAFHDRVASDAEGVVTAHYLDARVHPGDRRAPGQTSLALVSKKGARSTTGFANSARYTPLQLASIELSVGEDPDGRDIRAQITDSVTAARRAREAARASASEAASKSAAGR